MVELKYGPLNKSLFTQEAELFAKCLIHAPDKIQFSLEYTSDQKPILHGIVGNIDIDVSTLFRKANHTHIQLNEKDSDVLKQISFIPDFNSNLNIGITDAEYHAIQRYTGSFYSTINRFLLNKFEDFRDYYSVDELSEKEGSITLNQYSVNDVVVNTLMLASGLNKIAPSTEEAHPSYRGESRITPDQIEHRIELINDGGGLTDEPLYMSTSIDRNVSENFSTHSIIIFEDMYGKDISSISIFPDEQEFLLTPSTILWESHETVDDHHIFHAKMVTPLIDGKDDVTESDLDTFTKLYTWAKEEGINTDFLTPHLLHQLNNLSHPEPQILQLQDCIDFQQDEIFLPSASAEAPLINASSTHPFIAPPSIPHIELVASIEPTLSI